MKYIIDLPEEFAEATKEYWNKTVGTQLELYIEPDRKAIEDAQEKAWELASAIVCPSDCNVGSIQKYCKEIFGVDTWEIRGIFTNNTYQEAKAKYEAWMKQKNELHVGDEIVGIYSDGEVSPPLVVLKVEGNYYYGIYSKTGDFVQGGLNYEKTGRHFDEVKELLEKIKEK